MENLIIKGTNRTPAISFESSGNIRISGRSIPEDSGLFYNMIYSWVFQYCMQPAPATNIYIELEYMNSGSAKSILQILREFSNIPAENSKIIINWYYETGDEDMLEKGEYFETILKQEFKYIISY